MIKIALRTFLIDIGLNIMFDKIKDNFNIGPLVDIIKNDPDYLMYGERLKLFFIDGFVTTCMYKECITINGINYLSVFFGKDDEKLYETSKIMLFDRLDYDNAKYDKDGYIDIEDDETISDDKIIEWLKEKRDD